MTNEEVIEWLREHPGISKTVIEQSCDPPLPESTLRKAVNGTRPLPEKHLPALKKVLHKYGLPIDNIKKKKQ